MEGKRLEILEERTTEGIGGVQVIERRTVDAHALPVDGCRWFSQVWRSVDGGRTFAFCGTSRDFRTRAEAEAYTLADYDEDARRRRAEAEALHGRRL